jgi:hypothetical protein
MFYILLTNYYFGLDDVNQADQKYLCQLKTQLPTQDPTTSQDINNIKLIRSRCPYLQRRRATSAQKTLHEYWVASAKEYSLSCEQRKQCEI